jgi:tape measure domain-containing protein
MADDLKTEFTISLKDLLTPSLKAANKYADALDKKLGGIAKTSINAGKAFGTAFTSNLGGIKQASQEAEKLNQKVNQSSGLFGKLAAIGGAIGVGALAKGVLDTGQQFENAEVQLKTLLGSAGEANKTFNSIKKDAASTPFDVKSLLTANTALISAGEDAGEARKNVMALGNAIAASGGGSSELERMAVNLNQIKSLGKASALDIKQFVFAGIPIYKLLSKELGVTEKQAANMEITYEQLTYALKQAGKEGHMFAGGLENAMNTTTGKVSNLGDTFANLQDVIFKQVHP